MLRHQVVFGAGLAALAALVVACGGGGGSSPLPHSGSGAPQTTGATVKVFIPRSGSSSSTRKPAYISSSAATIAIAVYTVDGATPSPTSAPVSVTIATSSDCTTGTNGVSCTITVTVPVATAVVLQLSEYDASGNLLAQSLLGPINTTLATIPTQSVSIGGVPATIVISPSGLAAGDDGQTHTVTFGVYALDAAGNTIIQPGAYPNPIALSITGDTNGALALSPSSIASPGPNSGATAVTLTYNSAIAITQATIAAKSGSIGASVPFAPIVFTPTSLPSLFVGGSPQTVTVSEAGYAGAFNVTGTSSVATVACVPANCAPASAGGSITVSVAPGGAGTETVSIVDANGGFANLPITVTGSGGGGELVGPPYTIYEYATTSGGKNFGITVGPDGQTLWFLDRHNAEVGSVASPAGCSSSCGTISEVNPFYSPPPAALQDITAASDGNLYFTDAGNGSSDLGSAYQATCTPSCTSTAPATIPLDLSTPAPTDVTAGPDGNLYIASAYSDASTYSGILWQPVIGCCSYPNEILVGPAPSAINMLTFDSTGQYLWFTDTGTNTVGFVAIPCTPSCTTLEEPGGATNFTCNDCETAHRRVSPSSAHRVTPLRKPIPPRRDQLPQGYSFTGPLAGIVAAPDGNIYVADQGAHAIDQIDPLNWENYCTPSCGFGEIALPSTAVPVNLTVGTDGNVWFTDASGSVGFIAIDTCATSCKVYEYSVGGSPWGIVSGPDGDIWFTDSSTSKIGKVVL